MSHRTCHARVPALLLCGLVGWTQVAIPYPAFAQDAAPNAPPTRVEFGKAVEREIAAGQSHEYVVEVPAGGFFHADVEQHGVDFAVSLFDPSGTQLTEIDSLTGTESAESVSLVAKTGGTYRFVVHLAPDADPASGSYVVKSAAPRPATARDERRVAGEYASYEALGVWLEETDEARRTALTKYGVAAAAFREAAEPRLEAETLSTIGAIHLELRETAPALDAFTRAIALRRSTGDAQGEAIDLGNVAAVRYQLGQFAEASTANRRVLELAEKIGDRELEGRTLVRLGVDAASLGNKAESLRLLTRALPLVREHAEPVDEARALTEIGLIHIARGDRALAVEHLTSAVAAWKRSATAAGQVAGVSRATRYLGYAYALGGDHDTALRLYAQSLDLSRSADDRAGVSETLNLVGQTYEQLGDGSEAIAQYVAAFAEAEQVGDRAGQARILNNLGFAYATLERGREDTRVGARYLSRAVDMWRALGDRYNLGSGLVNLGRLRVRTGEIGVAIPILRQALRQTRATGNRGDEGIALKLLGDAYRKRRAWEAALASYEQALPLSRGHRVANAAATVLLGMALVERDRGRLDAARARIEQALEIVEASRSRLASQELRSSYLSDIGDYFETYVDILMRMHRRDPSKGYDGEALRACERGRARALVELIAESNADVRGGLDPDTAARLAAVRGDIDAKSLAEVRALSAGDADTARALRAEIADLVRAHETAVASAAAASPKYAEISRPSPLTAAEIQRQVLDADTTLVEYSLGEDRSYAWVVTPTSMRSFTLAPRATIEAAARAVHDLATSPNGPGPKRGLGLKGAPVADATKPARARALRAFATAALRLNRLVLDPLVPALGSKRLLVVADGALHYVPFAALPAPGSSAAAYTPLVVEREIVNAPSASTIAAIRRERATRPAAPKVLAVVADPVFDAADERVKRSEAAAPAADATGPTRGLGLAAVNATAKDVEVADPAKGIAIPRLPATRREAEAIAKLTPAAGTLLALDFSASRGTALRPDLGEYRYVHFATHGFVNATRPELSGLVLSLYDEAGAVQPGFLRLVDIFAMRLGADLVVLSACETGLGKQLRGEGLVGLTRGFMYAGSPRVVVSLWSVNDRATADLMIGLYDGMLAKGMAPSAALRAAQIALYRQERSRAPFYWAPFVLQGDWR
jgi:CHAT domain-containing protein/tetratricopeptide (TPR) repeat protein